MPVCVLVVAERSAFAELLVDAIRRAGHQATAGDLTALDDDGLADLAVARSASVVLLDVGFGRGRLPLLERLAAGGTDVVALTGDDPEAIERAIALGAVAAVGMTAPLERILTAVHSRVPGSARPWRLGADAAGSTLALTPREHQVLRGLVAGRSAKDIAAALGVALPTVRTQIRSVYRRLGVNNQRAAILAAVRDGWSVHGATPDEMTESA